MPIARMTSVAACLSLAALLQTPAPGQTPYEIAAKFDTATGLLLIPVAVNGSTFWCNLDSGFSALFTLDERLTDRAGLTPGPAHPTPDGRPPTPGDRDARATVNVGGVVLRDHTVILRKFFPEAPDMQCVMGVGVLRDYIVEFDYDTPRVRLYGRDDFVPGRAAIVPLTMRRNTPFVDVELQMEDSSRPHAEAVVDTGASYFSFVLVPELVERARVMSLMRPARQPSAGALRLLSVRIPAIAVGPWTAPGQVAALLEGSAFAGIHDGLLGSGFLRQFTVALDFVGARMYLTPNKRFGAPQPFDASGVAFRRTSDGSGYEVAVVIPDTPAARAEIRAGDRLLRINGMTVDALTPLELQDMLSRPGVTLALEMRRGDQVVVISLALVKRI